MAEPAAATAAAAPAPPQVDPNEEEEEEAPRKAPATEVERLLARVGGGFPPGVAREANQLLRKLAVKMKPGTLGKVRCRRRVVLGGKTGHLTHPPTPNTPHHTTARGLPPRRRRGARLPVCACPHPPCTHSNTQPY
jgi:hypothetical protein